MKNEKLIFHIITLFPEMFKGPFCESILKRAQDKGLLDIDLINLRNFAEDKHKTVDDTPYGGGKGMVIKVDVVDKTLSAIKCKTKNVKCKIILLDPRGEKFNQDKAIELANYDEIVLICGHYEGFDERIREHLVDESISIGDFVLTGGELPAMCIVDAVSRMVPGVLAEGSASEETFMKKDSEGNYLPEFPQYTRPEEYKGWKVPKILKSGDHKKIAQWRDDHR